MPFLYLANDILQNSRRKGPEFVNEFWTVLPRVLREVVDSGAESVKNAAYRLVWVADYVDCFFACIVTLLYITKVTMQL